MARTKAFDETETLSKAMNLFWKQGYAATSVQDLVDHLGINRASLYDTFGGKEALFVKSFELYRKINTEALQRFLQSEPNVKTGFSNLFSIAINQALTDEDKKGCFVVNTTTELVPNDEKILDSLEQNKNQIENLFFEYLKKGRESGQLLTQQDLKSLASLLFTIYNGLKVVSKVRPNKKELSASINVAMSLLH
jgi:TetR/AcrR family transcriptional repressor of nem operon